MDLGEGSGWVSRRRLGPSRLKKEAATAGETSSSGSGGLEGWLAGWLRRLCSSAGSAAATSAVAPTAGQELEEGVEGPAAVTAAENGWRPALAFSFNGSLPVGS
eukprot:GHVT01073939.1.p1 GENE.GHVT01073939.1~~GHVT01073939.1.p1  ORF type:complete len:104 (+),score=25.41 GHVT01073939.1:161-472(+)